METQSKFLNKQYLETRLREIREIKRKEITFDIEEVVQEPHIKN